MLKKRNNTAKIIFFWALLLVFLPNCIVSAAGASLTLYPSAGTFNVGGNFSVKVNVSSGGNSINAADGVIGFDNSLLSVVSLSKTGSIFSLWTTEPSFSNSAGTINFGGGTPQAFSGNSGTLFTINFKAKSSGSTIVRYSSGSVLAADFKGTNVLSTLLSGNYVLAPKNVTPPITEYVPPKNSPEAPKIFSSTHPNQDKWYTNKSPRFNWEITQDITGVKLQIDKNPLSVPSVSYGSITEKQLDELNDGTWYFHVQLQNSFGWGWIAHYKINIDTLPPENFSVVSKEGIKTTNSSPTIFFPTKDKTSGVANYEILLDQNITVNTTDQEYKLPSLAPGSHTVIVKAIDRAGNFTLSLLELNIQPIESPVITESPQTLSPNSILVLKGTALPGATVKISIENSKKEIKTGEAKTDDSGNWFFAEIEPLSSGAYRIWAESHDLLGGKSSPSNVVSLLVTQPIFIRIGQLAISYLSVIITLLFLIIIIALMILWIWRKIREKKKNIKREAGEAEKAVLVAFKALRDEVAKQASRIDGQKGLSDTEKNVSQELKKALYDSERFINKEVKDVIDEIK